MDPFLHQPRWLEGDWHTTTAILGSCFRPLWADFITLVNVYDKACLSLVCLNIQLTLSIPDKMDSQEILQVVSQCVFNPEVFQRPDNTGAGRRHNQTRTIQANAGQHVKRADVPERRANRQVRFYLLTLKPIDDDYYEGYYVPYDSW